MVKHTQAIRRQFADELFVFEHFVKLVLKGLKGLFGFEIFRLLSWLVGYVEKRFLRKLMLISKFVMSQTEQQIIAIHTLSTISRSKGK